MTTDENDVKANGKSYKENRHFAGFLVNSPSKVMVIRKKVLIKILISTTTTDCVTQRYRKSANSANKKQKTNTTSVERNILSTDIDCIILGLSTQKTIIPLATDNCPNR